LRVFENRMLRRIFGSMRDEETEEWSKLYHEKLNDLYCSLNIVRVIRSTRMEEDRMPKKIFTQELEGTRRKGRLRKRWKEEVEWIKGQRISWLGNLQRMEEYRMPKKIFTQEMEGTRRRGRPRKIWKEEAERDLPVLGVRRWRELVADREKWKDIFRQAKAHSGL